MWVKLVGWLGAAAFVMVVILVAWEIYHIFGGVVKLFAAVVES